jgi:uncharacterized protein (DUF433 family)
MDPAVKADSKIMHGTPCFVGTRVAVQTFFDWLEEGHSIDYFLEQFPSVKREQVIAVLESAERGRGTGAAAMHEREPPLW